MDYNWEEIFIDKSNKELYDIYMGDSNLPDSTIQIAKKELVSRNFDFENMGANKAAWRLSKLLQEEDLFESEVLKRKLTKVSVNEFLLIILGIVLVFLLFVPNSVTVIGLPIFISLATLLDVLNNFFYKKEQEIIRKRRSDIVKLTKKLEKDNLLKTETPIFKDIVKERKRNLGSTKIILYITVVVTIILIILKITKNYP